MTSERPEDGWGRTELLAYVFLCLTHGTDGEVVKEERHALVDKILRWDPVRSRQGAKDLLTEVSRSYLRDHREQLAKPRFARALKRLRRALSAEELSRAISDMVDLAQADGVVLDSEWDVIDEARRAWSVRGS